MLPWSSADESLFRKQKRAHFAPGLTEARILSRDLAAVVAAIFFVPTSVNGFAVEDSGYYAKAGPFTQLARSAAQPRAEV
jgi:hypothetical protein